MDLVVEQREKIGTSAVNELRRKGLIPGEVYGRGFTNVHVTIPAKDFKKVFKAAGETTVVSLMVGKEKLPVLIHDVSHDPVSDEVAHVDFHRIHMDEKLTAKVPVECVGDSPAVKEGGVLVKPVHEIEVEALPANMPHTFTLDLSKLVAIGNSLYVKDLPIEELTKKDVIIKVAPDTVLATIIAPRAEEEAPPPAPTMADVKVETEEKKAERDKEKAAGGEAAETKETKKE